ncbi:MAG: glycosyl hydrolase [Flavobacteriales bacterium]|nr:glycosyl hydrolase [Flavobacteriales bacterium]
MRLASILILIIICTSAQNGFAQKRSTEKPDSVKNISLSGLKFRGIGPAITGGRIVDIAVDPQNPYTYFVASGHGSLWKTENSGTTFFPAFDGQSAFAIGAVEIDPQNPKIVWVGTGEHNNQSNVIYGDGVYRSEDGGKSWKNMGLKHSEHIGGIAIHPKNSNIVYVAAYGSTRIPNADRGVYKTQDGGTTWEKVLFVSEHTGCFEIHMDPEDPEILYASMHQRMRKDYTVLRGGPETAIYRTLNGGRSWEKIMKGISAANKGRIGMCISPADPFVLYACVESNEGGGVFRSDDRGASWSKQSSYTTSYPFYMQKLVAHPTDVHTIYAMDVRTQVSTDGGVTFKDLGEKLKHVDNHALWIDPADPRHMISGCDGGVYETWDEAKNWQFKANLPITEIYKISTDNAEPFYNVYIGTQDNLSLVGPSGTINSSGITNSDWTFTKPGDGFESQADWSDHHIVYAQSQFGHLVRYDKRSGERLVIQPEHEEDSAYRFDWDAPLLLSKHDPKRLYFAAQVLFKTEDRGNSWKVISPDLSRGVPQKMHRVAGKSWSIDDMISKGSQANISSIAESPLNERVLYVGTADGLIHYTNDGGKTWQRSKQPEGVTEGTRVHHIIASSHNEKVAYATCQALNSGNYAPMVYKSEDGGKTWRSIVGNLPVRGSTYCIAEDPVKADLLFVGTQFGLYMTINGGAEWIRFMNGLPTTTVMDMEIQKRENDLVVSTFGRGVYILDDYSPLRSITEQSIQDSFRLFPLADAHMFVQAHPFGYPGTGFQGAAYYSAPNPESGAVITYYVKCGHKSLKDLRKEREKEILDKNGDLDYPAYGILKAESEEQPPYLLFTISDEEGNIVRKIKRDINKGVQRFTWDLRYDAFGPFVSKNDDDHKGQGYMVVPGTYTVRVLKIHGNRVIQMPGEQKVRCLPLNNSTLPRPSSDSLTIFNKKIAELLRVIQGTEAYRKHLEDDLAFIEKAVLFTNTVPMETGAEVEDLKRRLKDLNQRLNGDPLRSRYEGAQAPTIRGRVEDVTYSLWSTTAAPTASHKKAYAIVRAQIEDLLQDLQKIDSELNKLNGKLDTYQTPYTPGRVPVFREK